MDMSKVMYRWMREVPSLWDRGLLYCRVQLLQTLCISCLVSYLVPSHNASQQPLLPPRQEKNLQIPKPDGNQKMRWFVTVQESTVRWTWNKASTVVVFTGNNWLAVVKPKIVSEKWHVFHRYKNHLIFNLSSQIKFINLKTKLQTVSTFVFPASWSQLQYLNIFKWWTPDFKRGGLGWPP